MIKVCRVTKVTEEFLQDLRPLDMCITSGEMARKGLKRRGPFQITIGWCGEDIASNLITVLCEGKYVRAPRICNQRDYLRKRFRNKWR